LAEEVVNSRNGSFLLVTIISFQTPWQIVRDIVASFLSRRRHQDIHMLKVHVCYTTVHKHVCHITRESRTQCHGIEVSITFFKRVLIEINP
jgi:hypothetical protein